MSYPFHLCPDLDELHCRERLNYVLGQVLGVKEFQQEQTYFLHQNRLHNRSLHGYGTVWGLAVTTANTGDALEIQVAPGVALDTQGREVWVDALQCAKLNVWLAAATTEGSATANWETLTPIAPESDTVAVYVTLCYHPCPTGAQPILGNPCRADTGEEGVIQNTRIRDEFELQLRAVPPRQWEEDWVRSIADLLGRIDIDPGMADLDGAAIATLTQTLRDGLDDPARIAAMATQRLPQAQAEAVLRDLLRYWVTHTRPVLDQLHNPVLKLLEKIEVDDTLTTLPTEAEITAQIQQLIDALDAYERSPQLTAIDALAPVTVPEDLATRYRRAILQHWSRKPIATCQTTEDDCILLAAVQFRITEGGRVDETPVDDGDRPSIELVDLQRPYLLHTRLIQELVLQAFIQTSVDELALGSGMARYAAPTEADPDEPGVFPVEPLPDGVTVAFDVVVPNPTLGTGDARYATGDERSGVIPIEPLPDVVQPDGTTVRANVAFDVVVPRPQHGLGEVRFSSGEADAPRVEPSANPAPDDADVAFDVILPERGEGRVFLEGSAEAIAANISPPRAGVYPRSSESGSDPIAFDVVIPVSPGTAPSLGNGAVHVAGTPAAGGRGPGVYPARTPAATVAFDVVIPGTQSEALLPPVMLRPIDLVMFSNQELPTVVGSGVVPARPANIRGYPALAFPAQSSSVAGLNVLRPIEFTKGASASLRLYCTALKGEVSWQVVWRWVRSIPARPGQDGQIVSELRQDGFDSRSIDMVFDEDGYHLHVSEFVALNLNDAPEDADYLMAYLLPKLGLSGDGEDAALYLLMAELRWEVG